MLRSIRLLVLMGLVGFAACGIDDILVGAVCLDDGDCPGLSCVRTASLSDEEFGRCSADDACIAGEQEGCRARPDGTCDASMQVVEHEDSSYCCEGVSGQIPSVAEIDEAGTARCTSCPECETDEEECEPGDDACVIEGDAICGCRPNSESLLNSLCDASDPLACGGFESLTCVVTLEQMAEPDESQPAEQAEEMGLCREDDACVRGQQAGCASDGGSCPGSGLQAVDTSAGLTFCCTAATASGFFAAVYATTASQDSAACTQCERGVCPDAGGFETLDQCTELSDPDCNVSAGSLCGCPPPPSE